MLEYSEFLKELFCEASISDVKAAAISAVEAGKYSYTNTEESRFQFARDMKAEGFRGSEVSNAWKSLAVTGEIFKKGSAKPVAKPVVKKEAITASEVKALEKAWADVQTAYDKAHKLSATLYAKVSSANAGVEVHIRKTPDLYAVLKGLQMSAIPEDNNRRLAQTIGFVGDVGRHYKNL
ncbi:hypothetical protein fHeYen901_153 [Yersinia phage fHe-Yen9-01]|uniref:Uncharacterized protein n=1 Tax=Yersinia phage fHe-Yen9-01 TaxID=1965363 RepID=A0A1V0DXP5_9CAUD|nr:hypothetical protein KNT60_gp152 [Yersinia phage fHe-Yen9-01]ARB05926.1 hypothetical protein fHeYen901_153 [Yersinia phage fHe-Yen9-01]